MERSDIIAVLESWGWSNLHGKSDEQLMSMLASGQKNTQSQSSGTGKAYALITVGELDALHSDVQANLDTVTRSGAKLLNSFVHNGSLMALIESPITGELTEPEDTYDADLRTRAGIPAPASPWPKAIAKLMVLCALR